MNRRQAQAEASTRRAVELGESGRIEARDLARLDQLLTNKLRPMAHTKDTTHEYD